MATSHRLSIVGARRLLGQEKPEKAPNRDSETLPSRNLSTLFGRLRRWFVVPVRIRRWWRLCTGTATALDLPSRQLNQRELDYLAARLMAEGIVPTGRLFWRGAR